jgi:hypothetical protein
MAVIRLHLVRLLLAVVVAVFTHHSLVLLEVLAVALVDSKTQLALVELAL